MILRLLPILLLFLQLLLLSLSLLSLLLRLFLLFLIHIILAFLRLTPLLLLFEIFFLLLMCSQMSLSFWVWCFHIICLWFFQFLLLIFMFYFLSLMCHCSLSCYHFVWFLKVSVTDFSSVLLSDLRLLLMFFPDNELLNYLSCCLWSWLFNWPLMLLTSSLFYPMLLILLLFWLIHVSLW